MGAVQEKLLFSTVSSHKRSALMYLSNAFISIVGPLDVWKLPQDQQFEEKNSFPSPRDKNT